MEKIYDVLIFGGGVIGCSIASDLSRSGYSVCLVDKASDVSTGSSKANSGLVHAGFDAKTGSLKARLNVEGHKMYPSLCSRLGLPLKKTGALVAGNNLDAVKELYQRGINNGVKNLFILNQTDMLKLVPNLNKNLSVGLYAKDAYIVSPYLLTICLAEESIINGAHFELDFNAKKVSYKNNVFEVSSQTKTIFARKIINCAGAGVNDIQKLLKAQTYPIEFRRGEYFVLDHSQGHITPLTLFPLPDKHSKGILITPTIDGNILVGPTSYSSDDSTKTTSLGLNEIREKSAFLLENVNFREAIRVFSGVRSIVGDDFIVEQTKENVLTIAGICSPGLSAAPALSKYAIEKFGLVYNPTKKTKQISPYFLFKDLSTKKQNELIKIEPTYGELVCKCENITKGDILFALNRPLKINSLDGVKRRVRAGMGRCQSGFCMMPVAEIIAKTRKLPLEKIIKENQGSNLIVGDIRGGAKC